MVLGWVKKKNVYGCERVVGMETGTGTGTETGTGMTNERASVPPMGNTFAGHAARGHSDASCCCLPEPFQR